MDLLRRRGVQLAAILLSTFVLFAPAIHFAFVWDDHTLIEGNPRLTSWSQVPGYFTAHLFANNPDILPKYYRPLHLLWFRLVDATLGASASALHLASILAHLGAAACVFLLIYRLTQSAQGASLASLLFAVHPVQTEAVAWTSSVCDPLVTVFLVLTLYFYVIRKGPFSPLSLLFASLAMLTKEPGIVAPFLILFYEWAHSRYKEGVQAAVPYLLPASLYLLARWRVLGSVALSNTAHPMTFWQMVLSWPQALAEYVFHLLWPARLSASYDFPIRTSLWPLLLLLLVTAAFVWKLRSASPTVRFGAAWALITLAPALAFRYVFQDDCIHDRYLYLPFVGIALMLAPLLGRIRLNLPRGAVAGVAVLALCWQTHRTLLIWRNDETMFTRSVQVAPNNPIPKNGLAAVYLRENLPHKALPLLLDAVRLKPNYGLAYVNLVHCYHLLGDDDTAMHYMRLGMTMQKR